MRFEMKNMKRKQLFFAAAVLGLSMIFTMAPARRAFTPHMGPASECSSGEGYYDDSGNFLGCVDTTTITSPQNVAQESVPVRHYSVFQAIADLFRKAASLMGL